MSLQKAQRSGGGELDPEALDEALNGCPKTESWLAGCCSEEGATNRRRTQSRAGSKLGGNVTKSGSAAQPRDAKGHHGRGPRDA